MTLLDASFVSHQVKSNKQSRHDCCKGKTRVLGTLLSHKLNPKMIFTRSLSIFFSLSLGVYITFTKATTFHVVNQCPYTVWVAGSPLGGWQLNTGKSRSFTVNPGTKISQIWGRTNCSVDDDGRTKCQTGDCSGLLQCQNLGSPPLTLAEISLNGSLNLDFMDISLVYGFNIPMSLGPATNVCRTIQCSGDIIEQCPEDLQAPGGCYSACKVFKTGEYCCPGLSCGPTEYSRFFKKRCPNAYTYPYDDANSTFTCPAGTNYKVVFCPSKMGIKVHDHGAHAATFSFTNNCGYTVWPGTLTADNKPQLSSTGFELASKASTSLTATAPWTGRFWGRTGCTTDSTGKFSCSTGDCASGQVTCNGAGGIPPATLAEFTLAANNGQDFYDVSNVDGFNLPISVTPQGGNNCKVSGCPANINSVCPAELAVKGSDGSVIACKSACLAFNEAQYCCTGDHSTPETCPATSYSEIFSNQCPEAYSYAYDDLKGTFTCTGEVNYLITFCP